MEDIKDITGLGELSTNSLELIKIIYPDLAQLAVKKIGIALENTLDFLTIPTKYLGLIGKKHDINIQKHLKDVTNILDSHPEENIGTVPPEIGVPIIEDLTRVTNQDLATMYINLLVNASLIDKSRYAHPCFINVIRCLSADEAKIINHYKEEKQPFMSIELIRDNISDQTMSKLGSIFINVDDQLELHYKQNVEFYFDNLTNLGILTQNANFPLELKKVVENKKEDINIQKQILVSTLSQYERFDEGNATYVLSKFGKEFIKSISI